MSWLEELPDRSWFWSRQVPGAPSTAHVLLSRLAQDPGSVYTRIARGFYFKGHPADPLKGCSANTHWSALLHAGAGAGLRKFDGLNNLGWSSQLSARVHVSTLRRVQPFERWIRYTRHPNRLRAALTWTEVTLLEALSFLRFAEMSWPECLESIADGTSRSRLPWRRLPFELRRDLMLGAAECEPGVNVADLKFRISEVCEAASAQQP